jgi:PPK2 family polyphosphate:nucleotide phosphotransferase
MKIDKFCFQNGNGFKLSDIKCNDTLKYSESDRPAVEEEMKGNIEDITKLQDKLYAENTRAILLIIQAMDAAGKDGTIKHVASGINPQGCSVVCFKAPSPEELDHDYLWRISKALPQRGTIGIFNRSHYEDVLVAKVHDLPSKLPLPEDAKGDHIWEKRYRQINDFERYLFENGIIPVKIFLHVSKEEQKKRFLSRINEPAKNWKFSAGDLEEREKWDEYQDAFEDMIRETATKYAPWYVVPADEKWFARALVSDILLKTLKDLDPKYPKLSEEQKAMLEKCKIELEKD